MGNDVLKIRAGAARSLDIEVKDRVRDLMEMIAVRVHSSKHKSIALMNAEQCAFWVNAYALKELKEIDHEYAKASIKEPEDQTVTDD